MCNNDDTAPAAVAPTAGAECAAGSKEECRPEGSRQQDVRRTMRWSCVPPLPPSPAAAPSSTWCVCSGTRSSPESRRGAGPRRWCAAPAPTGSGTSGSCAPASAAAPGWKRCGSVGFLPETSGASPDAEPSPPACSFHLLENALWVHLWEKLLKKKKEGKSRVNQFMNPWKQVSPCTDLGIQTGLGCFFTLKKCNSSHLLHRLFSL